MKILWLSLFSLLLVSLTFANTGLDRLNINNVIGNDNYGCLYDAGAHITANISGTVGNSSFTVNTAQGLITGMTIINSTFIPNGSTITSVVGTTVNFSSTILSGNGNPSSSPTQFYYPSLGTDYTTSSTPLISFAQAGGGTPNVTSTLSGQLLTMTPGTMAGQYTVTGVELGNSVKFSSVTAGTTLLYTVIGYNNTGGNNYLVLSASPGNATNPVGFLGGACGSIPNVFTTTGNTISRRFYVQHTAQNYTISSSITGYSATCGTGCSHMASIIGYCNIFDDMPAPGSGCQPVITPGSGFTSTQNAIFAPTVDYGYTIQFVTLDGTAGGSSVPCGVAQVGSGQVSVCNSTSGTVAGSTELFGDEIRNMTAYGAVITGSSEDIIGMNNYIHGVCTSTVADGYREIDWSAFLIGNYVNTGGLCDGILVGTQEDSPILVGNVLVDNVNGINLAGANGYIIKDNILYGNTSNGIDASGGSSAWTVDSLVVNNILSTNTTNGITGSAITFPTAANAATYWMFQPNAFYNNGTNSLYAIGNGSITSSAQLLSNPTGSPVDVTTNFKSPGGLQLEGVGLPSSNASNPVGVWFFSQTGAKDIGLQGRRMVAGN